MSLSQLGVRGDATIRAADYAGAVNFCADDRLPFTAENASIVRLYLGKREVQHRRGGMFRALAVQGSEQDVRDSLILI